MTADPWNQFALFHALTEPVPEAEACTAMWAEADRIVALALSGRPAAMRRQLVLFIRILNALAVLRYGRGLVS